METTPRMVAHMDMDAYFASCEALRHPEWAGQPLVVGADPQSGRGRGVVVAANYPARALGIRSAMPIQEAWRRAPQAHFVAPDHRHYSTMSHRVFDALRTRFAVQQTSIDEGCLDATDLGGWDAAAGIADEIRATVMAATSGLTCSVGVAPSRLVAKIASDRHKPNGTTVVPPDQVRPFLDPLPAKVIPGVGPKTAPRLAEAGIHTIRDLRTASLEGLTSRFGPHAAWMQRAAQGIDESIVRPEGDASKTVSEEHTFSEDTKDRRRLLASLRRMVASLESDLTRHGYWYRSVALKVRYSDFTTQTRQMSLRWATGDTTPARRVLPALLDAFLGDARRIRLVGVRFGDLRPRRPILSQFDPSVSPSRPA